VVANAYRGKSKTTGLNVRRGMKEGFKVDDTEDRLFIGKGTLFINV